MLFLLVGIEAMALCGLSKPSPFKLRLQPRDMVLEYQLGDGTSCSGTGFACHLPVEHHLISQGEQSLGKSFSVCPKASEEYQTEWKNVKLHRNCLLLQWECEDCCVLGTANIMKCFGFDKTLNMLSFLIFFLHTY